MDANIIGGKVVANIKIITKLSADLTVTVKKIKLKGLM